MTGGAWCRVLCVDDNRDVAESLVMLLTLVGFDARACFDGASALAEAATFCPHAGVLDLNMPGMNGYELARRLREQLGPRLFLMAVTAVGDPDTDRRVVEAGFNLKLTKPADPNQLLAVLTRFQQALSV
ncbi:MAG TPA: response regulator [Fimbriiglobus sp.]|nr:response regulator [Fimbriiglobus sp.]